MIDLSLLAAALLALSAPKVVATPPTTAPPDAPLRSLRQSAGGTHWSHVGGLLAEGTETSDGLSGAWSSAVDLRSGQYATHAHNPVFSGADGFDAKGRWHQDVSGLVHPCDSEEARTVAISVSWLERFGFLFPLDRTVQVSPLPDVTEGGHVYRRLEVTPPGGRTLTLWIDPATQRLDRVVWRSSFQPWTRRYSDYRTVGGLVLPFRIVTEVGGPENATVDLIRRYRVLARVPASALARPDGRVRDVTLPPGATRAVAPMTLEGKSLLLVWASINGKPPMPFLLDTGGHAILTTAAAQRLGLEVVGKGVSFGSGPGSMSTAYTRVAHLGLGEADIRDQTFLVMPYPYDLRQRGGGEPIAGLLGLEIFERFAVTLDYDHQRAIFEPYDHGAPPAARPGQGIPLRFTDDMPLVEARVDGASGMFGIDTGNGASTLVFPQWAERNGLTQRLAKGMPIPTGGVGGRYLAHVSHVGAVQLGDAKVENPLVMLTRADAGATGNPTEAGNIGQDLLARFEVHFDYRRQRMDLTPRAPVQTWPYATAGLVAVKDEAQPDRLRVHWLLEGGPAARAGLKVGDVITALNDTPASKVSFGAFRDATSHQPDGARVRFHLVDGRTIDVTMQDPAPTR